MPLQFSFAFVLFLLFFYSPALVNSHNAPVDQDVGLGPIEIAASKGYTMESYNVTTRDGYILRIFRIPTGKGTKVSSSSTKPVAFLQHGLLDSSWTWVANSEVQSLAYILADAGYDVWMGNNRGNRFSRNHKTLDPDSKEDGSFWEFTWDEMASEDLPTMIHFVTKTTSVKKLSYIGHSEGTIQMFAASTEVGNGRADAFLRDAIAKVNVFIALAPVAYCSHLAAKVFVAAAARGVADNLYSRGKWEFSPYRQPFSEELAVICSDFDGFCDLALMSVSGPSTNINASRMQVYLSEEPSGTSMRNMQHWEQGVMNAPFQKFDWGTETLNEAHYGTLTPPSYDLSRLTVPTAFFAGANDYLADPKDVDRMMSEVPADKVVYYEMREGYAHMDYVWGKTTYADVYNTVVELINDATETGYREGLHG